MIGTQVGRYRIESELGRGGMGVVYRGTQVTLDRTVAIKMLPAHQADAENRERFRREALTLARLAHPNIVHIYDVEDFEGSSFIVMEYVGGGSLGDTLSRGPVSAARAVEIMAPILSALHAAHLAGVVHRDLKPDNILFTESGRPRLTDFGIAHLRDAGSKTRTGVMLGTPYYMSPEQAQGRKVTAAADLYAVGVVLYEMLSGHVPFTGEDPVSVALQHVQAVPGSLASLRPDLPPELCALVHRALEKDPTRRFSSAAAMQDALESGTWAPIRALDPGSSGSRVAVPPPAEPTRPWGTTPSGASGQLPVPEPMSDESSSEPDLESRVHSVGGPDLRVSAAHAMRTGLAGLRTTGMTLGRVLARPGWRGLPIAFWTGVIALALAILWIGADAALAPSGSRVAGDSDTPPIAPPSSSSSETPPNAPRRAVDAVTGGGGGGSGRPTSTAGTRSGPARPTLSAQDLADLAALGTGAATATDSAAAESDRVSEILEALDPAVTPRSTVVDSLPRTDSTVTPVSPPPAETASAAARREIGAIIERQRQAVEQGDRALFLRDIHPDLRDEATEIFDDGYAGARNIRSTIRNVSIELLEPDHAFVSFDVTLSFIVRSDGRSEQQSATEQWDVIREGGRWWIIAWN